ncbi:MAG TPA: hypothetical protein VJO99_01810, partial [Burkholderiaceae bacterium]|nr:hypothetical protein [Burkholderiaceae bacterium]
MSGALRALADDAARVVPGLCGRVVAADAAYPPWHATAQLASVQRYWARNHPEAGPHYAALRGWGLLVWQPIYLAVIAAHVSAARLDLDRLSLVVNDGSVEAYRLSEHDDVDAPIDEAAPLHASTRQLAAGIAGLLPRWQAHAPL